MRTRWAGLCILGLLMTLPVSTVLAKVPPRQRTAGKIVGSQKFSPEIFICTDRKDLTASLLDGFLRISVHPKGRRWRILHLPVSGIVRIEESAEGVRIEWEPRRSSTDHIKQTVLVVPSDTLSAESLLDLIKSVAHPKVEKPTPKP